mmetsp:Transcript_2938/g.7150  ORF Transcript_2938/g.7150 Transcript_2938/m.7150 type:complete len:204 (+) Transcript_2938:1555-2166(+)
MEVGFGEVCANSRRRMPDLGRVHASFRWTASGGSSPGTCEKPSTFGSTVPASCVAHFHEAPGSVSARSRSCDAIHRSQVLLRLSTYVPTGDLRSKGCRCASASSRPSTHARPRSMRAAEPSSARRRALTPKRPSGLYERSKDVSEDAFSIPSASECAAALSRLLCRRSSDMSAGQHASASPIAMPPRSPSPFHASESPTKRSG